jgi:hypothetical protein
MQEDRYKDKDVSYDSISWHKYFNIQFLDNNNGLQSASFVTAMWMKYQFFCDVTLGYLVPVFRDSIAVNAGK